MIMRLRGELVHLSTDWVVIDVGGVGYQVFMSGRAIAQLPGEGSTVKVFTHLAHREDAMLLYGFASLEERELFLMLTSVSGVGTKTGLAILSIMEAHEVAQAIASSDTNRLAKAQGVGKKTAERIIVDLREKLSAKRAAWKPEAGVAGTVPLKGGMEEAELALLSLGFEPAEISRELATMSPATPLEEVIRSAIRTLSGF